MKRGTGRYHFAFMFQNHCHCTHKYLGKVDLDILAKAIQLVETYFSEHQIEVSQPRIWVFDQRAMFGKYKTVPVLLRSETQGMLLDLKAQLDRLVPDQNPEYKPHITLRTNQTLQLLTLKPIAYALREGKIEHLRWPFGGES